MVLFFYILPAVLVKELTHSLHHSSTPPTTKEILSFPLPTLSLPLKPAIPPSLDLYIRMAAAHPASHAYGLAYQADAAEPTAAHGPGPQSEHSLQARRQAQPKAGKERGEEAPGDKRQYNKRENFERVAFGIVDKVAEQALELFVRAV